MPRNALIAVREKNVTGAVQDFLKGLLDRKLVDALLVPVEVPSRNNVVHCVVTDSSGLDAAAPLAPVMPVNAARVISSMTKLAPGSRTIGAVLRPCELRALNELVKLKQADLTNVLTIGVDCYGTYTVAGYGTCCAEHGPPAEDYLLRAQSGRDDPLLREACRVCCHPAPLTGDIVLGLMGMEAQKAILVAGATGQGERVLETLGLEGGADTAPRDAAVAACIDERRRAREDFLQQARSDLAGLDNMLSALAPCVACHNCRVSCPICYCRECLLDSPTFMQWEADKYLEWASKKGALRMPADSLLFHLVRLNHMGASCVACGLCEEACPNGVSVFKLFCLAGSGIQQVFDYTAGKSIEDELPLTAFREDEFNDFGK